MVIGFRTVMSSKVEKPVNIRQDGQVGAICIFTQTSAIPDRGGARQPEAHTASAEEEAEEIIAAVSQEMGFAGMAGIGNPESTSVLSNLANGRDGTKCYHDSGANRHIAFDRAIFTNYKTIDPLEVKGVRSDFITSAIGVGDIPFLCRYNGKRTILNVSDVLHVPNARMNLISQGCLERKDIFCKTSNGSITLTRNGRTIAVGKLQTSNLFELYMTPAKNTTANANAATSPEITSGRLRGDLDFGTASSGM